MNLNRKAHRVRPVAHPSQASTAPPKRADLTPTHWLSAIGRRQFHHKDTKDTKLEELFRWVETERRHQAIKLRPYVREKFNNCSAP